MARDSWDNTKYCFRPRPESRTSTYNGGELPKVDLGVRKVHPGLGSLPSYAKEIFARFQYIEMKRKLLAVSYYCNLRVNPLMNIKCITHRTIHLSLHWRYILGLGLYSHTHLYSHDTGPLTCMEISQNMKKSVEKMFFRQYRYIIASILNVLKECIQKE